MTGSSGGFRISYLSFVSPDFSAALCPIGRVPSINSRTATTTSMWKPTYNVSSHEKPMALCAAR